MPVTREGGAPPEAHPPPGFEGARTEPPPAPETQRRTNLLAVPPTLYGRDQDLAAMADLLAEHRLVTITGAGGIGKTRLGQVAAARATPNYPDGVWWIELAPVGQGTLVANTIADVLDIDLSDGRDPVSTLLAHLRSHRMLIVLDNCEQVLDAVASLATAINDAASATSLLVTSQEVLRTSVEHVYRLGTLSLPDASAQLTARRNAAHVVETLARALILQGKTEEGIETARRALQLTRNEGFHFRLLEPLALNAANQGRLADAAWLTGHIDAAYAKRGEVRWPDASARRALIDAMLAEGLDRPALAALRSEGALSTTDEAFARAFGDN